ncbi:SH3 domain-containing protein [Candidatus Methylopumilus rimovensis]|uniref:SH3 domain-containing protein n=1 Tax=Candidatus Methylopumilus rimovensis TaxID=2588535 RepID=UPI001CB92ACD|nr:SH3 domain-containing protein [Candidatus Methylopumilus rimovensis]
MAQKTNFFFSYFFVWIVCFISQSAYAEFRSVAFAKTILYEAPSATSKRVYLVGEGYPLEIIVNLGDWLKVRDPYGTLSWAESKNLQSKRTVIVKVDKANIYKDPESKSALVATIEKDVVIELSDPLIANGWIKVRYQQDLDGYIQTSQVWGI